MQYFLERSTYNQWRVTDLEGADKVAQLYYANQMLVDYLHTLYEEY